MPYLFVSPVGDRVEIEGRDAQHLARSLRVRPGERIEAVDPGDGVSGRLLTVEVETAGADRVTGVVVEAREHRPEPRTATYLALAMLPAPALEQALARCTELGAAGFLLVEAERSVARTRAGGKAARWAAICREAAMLAGRLRVPEVEGPVPLARLVGQVPGELVLLDAGGRAPLSSLPGGERTLAVGPEGGWTAAERALVRTHASLGPRNLRAENAAAAALTVALAAAGDL
jgi:16S rRNA (uracil1498-N3)-methyltransferase